MKEKRNSVSKTLRCLWTTQAMLKDYLQVAGAQVMTKVRCRTKARTKSSAKLTTIKVKPMVPWVISKMETSRAKTWLRDAQTKLLTENKNQASWMRELRMTRQMLKSRRLKKLMTGQSLKSLRTTRALWMDAIQYTNWSLRTQKSQSSANLRIVQQAKVMMNLWSLLQKTKKVAKMQVRLLKKQGFTRC